MDMASSNSVQLTRGLNGHEDPAWSPDGKKVALVSDEGAESITQSERLIPLMPLPSFFGIEFVLECPKL
jgi:Tol biopolymer transport system component